MPPGVGTTHQVRIGSDYFLVRQGTYRKRGAPMFGARFTTGDPDYNNLSMWQHWVQRCWIGGFGAQDWSDEVMFDEGLGVNTSQHDVVTLARDLSLSTGGTLDAAGSTGRQFIVFNDNLYVVNFSLNTLWRWNLGTLTWELVHNFAQAVRSLEIFNSHLIVGTSGANLYRMSTAGVITAIAKPAGITVTPYTMRVYRGQLYVAFGKQIWRLNSSMAWDGSTAFYIAEDATYLTDAEAHLGQLYFASQNGLILRTDGNNTFEMWRFDPGPRIAALRSFDGRLFVSVNEPLAGTTAQEAVLYQFTGAAVTELKRWGKVGLDVSTGKLRSYGGKLYFGAGGMLGMGDATGFGVGVYDPREDSYHVLATNRDGTTFAGGTEGIDWTIDDVIIWRGWVWAAVRGHGIFRCIFSFKDVRRYEALYDTSIGGATVGPDNGGWYTSSDYDAGTPGLEKLWHAILLDIDLPPTGLVVTGTAATDTFSSAAHGLSAGDRVRFTSITGGAGIAIDTDYYVIAGGLTADAFKLSLTAGGASIDFTTDLTAATTWRYACTAMVEYSLDGGVSWGYAGATQAAATIGGIWEQSGRVRHVIPLQKGGLRGSRFKYRISLHTTDVQRSPQLRGVTVRYLPIPEPNWQWDMVLVLSDKQELLDKTIEAPDNVAKRAALSAAFRTQSLIAFEDVDGTDWAADGTGGVIIHSYEERPPHLGPSSAGALEHEIAITLIEVVEAYE